MNVERFFSCLAVSVLVVIVAFIAFDMSRKWYAIDVNNHFNQCLKSESSCRSVIGSRLQDGGLDDMHTQTLLRYYKRLYRKDYVLQPDESSKS